MKTNWIRFTKIITLFAFIAIFLLPGLYAQNQIVVTSTTGTSPLSYSELRLAFNAINAGTHGGDITIQITASTTESATAVLNASGSGSALYSSVTICPTVTGLSISGTINGGQIINLNGADKVTIDGRVNGTGSGWSAVSLTISNTSTVTTNNTATIRFSNVATQNVVKYCNLLGSSLISVDNDGGIVEFNQSGGNSNNTIYHNNFSNAGGNRPYKAIYSKGGASGSNSGNLISYNHFFDLMNLNSHSAAIFTKFYNTGNTITHNSIYETSTVTPTSTNPYYGIYFYYTVDGNRTTISNNYIGGSDSLCGGTPLVKSNNSNSKWNPFFGIYLPNGCSPTTTIANNTISNISWSNYGGAAALIPPSIPTTTQNNFSGIVVNGGTTDITGNTIGSTTGTGSITFNHANGYGHFYGIYYISGGNHSVSNNKIGSVTIYQADEYRHSMYGIVLDGNYTRTVSNNLIGSTTTANSFFDNSFNWTIAGQYIMGITTLNGASTLTGNTIANLTINYAHNSNKNDIIYGIKLAGTTNTVSSNFISELKAAERIIGISLAGNSNAITSNNFISLGVGYHALNYTPVITGIWDDNTGNSTILFNTVYVGGGSYTGASYAFYTEPLYSGQSTTRDYRNNLFVNARSGNNSKNIAAMITSNTNLTIDYNDYYTTDADGVMGYYNNSDVTSLASWRTTVGQDANSQNINPQFTNVGSANTTVADFKLGTALQGVAVGGYETDYLGVTRTTPFMGALDNYHLWTGNTSTDWATITNWSPQSVPVGTSNVVLTDVTNDPLLPSSEVPLSNLTINSSGSMIIGAGKSLTVNGVLSNNAGTAGLVILSNATGTGSLKHVTTNVPATIHRYVTGSATLDATTIYHQVSVPLTASSNPVSKLFANSFLFDYNVNTNSWNYLGTSQTTPLNVTKGYLIYYTYPSKTYQFGGYMNAGSFTPTTIHAGSGFNLIPNPYPSALDWEVIKPDASNVDNSIWLWSSVAGNYAVYTSPSSNTLGATQYIPLGQAFFVKTTGSSPTIPMSNEARVHNNQPFWKSGQTEDNLLKIKAEGNSFMDEVLVRLADGATEHFDAKLDAYKMYGQNEAPQLYTVTNDDYKLTINALPYSVTPRSIPLNFELTMDNPVVLSFSGMESFSSGFTLFLEDKVTKNNINLREQNTYSFNHLQNNDAGRFLLHFNGFSSISDDMKNGTEVWMYEEKLYINAPDGVGEKTEVQIYNLLGQKLYSEQISLAGLTTINPHIQGMVLVKVSTPSTVITRKGVLK